MMQTILAVRFVLENLKSHRLMARLKLYVAQAKMQCAVWWQLSPTVFLCSQFLSQLRMKLKTFAVSIRPWSVMARSKEEAAKKFYEEVGDSPGYIEIDEVEEDFPDEDEA